jgi:hypothetical protein
VGRHTWAPPGATGIKAIVVRVVIYLGELVPEAGVGDLLNVQGGKLQPLAIYRALCREAG